MSHPLISVIMPSYNHAEHIGDAIQSVLDQTCDNFELIITDDGSRDDSRTVIESFGDARIRPFFFEKNQGACAAVNNCIRESRGSYIAMISSDDLWKRDKLEIQLEFLQRNPNIQAVFALPEFIDESGRVLGRTEAADLYATFPSENMPRSGWIRHFFTKGNALCHPSMLIEKQCYDELGLYDNRLRQLPDFDMWVRFCKKFDLHILDQPLIRFRWFKDGSNTSSPTSTNMARIHNELYLIFQSFFDDMPEELFCEAFDVPLPETSDKEQCLEIEKTLACFRPESLVPDTALYLIGIRRLHRLLEDPSMAALLKARYDIGALEFHDKCAKSSALHTAFLMREIGIDNIGSASTIPSEELFQELWRRFRNASPKKIFCRGVRELRKILSFGF